MVAASDDASLAAEIQNGFSGPTFRVYAGSDPIGVEIGGALEERDRDRRRHLRRAWNGAQRDSGADYPGSCRIDPARGSSGRTKGDAIGSGGAGRPCFDLYRGLKPEPEGLACNSLVGRHLIASSGVHSNGGRRGVRTTSVAIRLAEHYGVEMPIAGEMHAVLSEGRAPAEEAIRRLMGRTPRGEFA